jgi:hypothetical protein
MLMPSSEASHQFEAGNKGAIKTTIGAKAGELWMVPIDMIRVVEGFNIRIQDEANEDAIERVKDSIIANGFYKNQPLKGYIGKEDGEDVLLCSGWKQPAVPNAKAAPLKSCRSYSLLPAPAWPTSRLG